VLELRILDTRADVVAGVYASPGIDAGQDGDRTSVDPR
jgi:hypothetical protein